MDGSRPVALHLASRRRNNLPLQFAGLSGEDFHPSEQHAFRRTIPVFTGMTSLKSFFKIHPLGESFLSIN